MTSPQGVSSQARSPTRQHPDIASKPQTGPSPRPPYAPQVAAIGGVPTVGVDVPICAVFLVLFLIGAAGHMAIFQLNRRKGHKFLMSALLFGFCMARIVTQVMHIVWACYPMDVSVAIAAMIFVSAGVLILFIVNLIFTQRIIRAAHPHFGWHRAFHSGFVVLYVLVVLMLAMVITASVQSFYTLNTNTRRIDADLQRAAGTYLMFVAFLPLPMIILGLVIPRKTRLEKFGIGRWRTKIWILLASSVLLCLGASFRLGTAFKNPRPRADPAWYDAKWCFYFFNFTVEIIVVYLYLILRVDRRFYIPDKSHGPGDYAPVEDEKAKETTSEPLMSSTTKPPPGKDQISGYEKRVQSEKGKEKEKMSAPRIPPSSTPPPEKRPRKEVPPMVISSLNRLSDADLIPIARAKTPTRDLTYEIIPQPEQCLMTTPCFRLDGISDTSSEYTAPEEDPKPKESVAIKQRMDRASKNEAKRESKTSTSAGPASPKLPRLFFQRKNTDNERPVSKRRLMSEEEVFDDQMPPPERGSNNEEREIGIPPEEEVPSPCSHLM